MAIEIPGLDIPKARRYSRLRLGIYAATTALSIGRTAWFAFSGSSARWRGAIERNVSNPNLVVPAYAASTALTSWAVTRPLSYLTGYRVERAFDLTRQSHAGWAADQGKSLAVGLPLQVAVISGVYSLIRRRPDDWWRLISVATVPISVVVSGLAPVLLAPLFNRYERLEDEALTQRIQRLGQLAGVDIADVYTMDMSRQTEKANAFFTGIGRTKRIVLSDTLLRDFTPDEVEAVVAHELGHQAYGDMWRITALAVGMTTGALYALHRMAPPAIQRSQSWTQVTGTTDIAALPVVTLLGSVLGFGMSPPQSAYSRAMERRTDQFAMTLTGDGQTYAQAMAKIASTNLADPDPPRAIVWFLYSHPPIAERIETALAFAANSGTMSD